MSGAEWIANQPRFDELMAEIIDEPLYAIDTEFHRERTYYPRLALLQIAWSSGIALIDPTKVDLSVMRPLLEGPGTAVLHAAQQDLEVMARACGVIPARMFDTQIAACFLGYSTPSLATLIQGELGLKLPKGDRLTDWFRRPLTDDQQEYAASDVAYLIEIFERQTNALEKLGRTDWVALECDGLRTRPTGPTHPELAWTRLKDVRTLRGKSRNVARSVAAWRERRAASSDQPVRFVLADLAILALAQRSPKRLEDLKGTRGLEERYSRGPIANELLAAVAVGLADETEVRLERDGDDLDRGLRPAVALVSAWVSQLAKDEGIDTGVLATRADLVELLAGEPDARLAHGWRAEVVGDGIRRLVAGEAALAFAGAGRLRLIDLPRADTASTGADGLE